MFGEEKVFRTRGTERYASNSGKFNNFCEAEKRMTGV